MSTLDQVPQQLYDEVIEMTQEGFSIEDTIEETGLTRSVIRMIRKDSGFHGRVVDPLAGLETDDMVTRYRAGQAVQAICTLHGIDRQKFYNILSLLGEPTRRYDPVREAATKRVLDEAVNMYEAGYYLYEIESETGIQQPRLHLELHRRGIQLRQPRGQSTVLRREAQIGGSRTQLTTGEEDGDE